MISAPLLIGLLAAVSFGGIALALAPYLSGEVKAEKRQAQFVNRTEARANVAVQRAASNRREQVTKSLKDIEQRQSDKKRTDLSTRIQQAGLSWSTRHFYVVSLVFGVATAFVVLLFTFSPWMALCGFTIGGLGLPQWMLGFLRKRRIKRFVAELPNAVDIIVRGVRSGLPLGDCMRIIASEAAEPLRSEFRYIIEAQGLGLPVAEAVERLYLRVPVTEANFFGIVIAIQQKSGGNLAETLSNFSRVLRERSKMKGKISAMSQEAKASAAIIAALPFIVAVMVYMSSPEYIRLLWTTNHGKMALLVSGFWMFCGIMVMRKMIAFDF